MTYQKKECGSLMRILEYLPPACRAAVSSVQRSGQTDDNELSEIRLREGRRIYIRVRGECLPCPHVTSREEIKWTVRALCSGAVYAYENTIRNGYIPVACGGRAGVVGIMTDENRSVAPETITALNIRIPHHIRGISYAVYDLFFSTRKGILIYSPPSVGKTTLLRDLAIELSRGNKALNVALIDTRRELDNGFIPEDCMIDTYSGYPKSLGIGIAARTMSSDVIICDELGTEEIEALRYTLICGVPVIASAHARDICELRARNDISQLINAGVFEYAVGINRQRGAGGFEFTTDRLR